MTESDVWRALISVLRSGLDAQGHSDITIHQSYQPIKQGPEFSKAVYLHKISSQRVGHQGRRYGYNATDEAFETVEKYWFATVIQLNAVMFQGISDENAPTAFDIVELCSGILQTEVARQNLLSAGMSIERIKEIRVTPSLDDHDEYFIDPSFDFTLLYEQVLTSQVPKITSTDVDIKRV